MKSRKSGSAAGNRHRRLLVEQLEGRALLAGNVNVFAAGGSLFVRGDNADNLVLIQQTGDGEYTVTGLDFADEGFLDPPFAAGPTLINGDAVQTFSGITGDIHVDLKKGDDGLGIGNVISELEALANQCNVGFAFSSGTDTLSDLFRVPRGLFVNTGEGLDGVFVNANVGRSAIINTGNGNDAVAFGSGGADTPSVGDNLLIDTGNGADDACVSAAAVDDLLRILSGSQDDEISVQGSSAATAVVVAGSGNDFVTAATLDVDNTLVVDTGAGNDGVSIQDSSARFLTAVTGGGNDSVEVTGGQVDTLTVNSGAGNDSVSLSTVAVANDSFLILGAGNDSLTILDSTVGRNSLLDAGAGNDDVSVENTSVGGTATILMGAGNDTLSAANSIARIVRAFGGSGRDTLNNDLGITANGTYEFDTGTTTARVEIRQFEEFGP